MEALYQLSYSPVRTCDCTVPRSVVKIVFGYLRCDLPRRTCGLRRLRFALWLMATTRR